MKSYAKPPQGVVKLCRALHAFICNLPYKKVEWEEIKRGPIFRRSLNLADIDMNWLTTK